MIVVNTPISVVRQQISTYDVNYGLKVGKNLLNEKFAMVLTFYGKWISSIV